MKHDYNKSSSVQHLLHTILFNIKTKAIYYRDFCYVTIFMLYNKKLCYIAHPNLPDVVPGKVTGTEAILFPSSIIFPAHQVK